MLEFIHLDTVEPKASYGQTLEEYASEERVNAYVDYYKEQGIDMTFEEAYENKKIIWERHHPPMGVKGLFAFVNRPENICVSVMPGDVKRELRKLIIETYDLDELPKSERLEVADECIRRALPKVNLSFMYKYTLDDVKTVYAHFYGDSEWWDYDPAEFEKYCTEEVYEVFLELK